MRGLIILVLLGVRLMCNPYGLVVIAVAGPVGYVLNLFTDTSHDPLGDGDVPRYVKSEGVFQQEHQTATLSRSPVITVTIRNSHPSRPTSTDLWVACSTYGTTMSDGRNLGTYESMKVFRAAHDIAVPPNSTWNVEFNTEGSDYNLQTGETVQQCVVGASEAQAMALMGYRPDDDHSQQGQMTSVTADGAQQGLQTGWSK